MKSALRCHTWILLIILLLLPSGVRAQIGGRLLIFNTLSDLLRGDLWESIDLAGVSRYLYVYPEYFQVLGIGTTSRPFSMGEIMLQGAVGSQTCFWANPEYPYQVDKVQDATFPWIMVALFDPKGGLNLSLKANNDLHQKLISRMQRENISICALRLKAITRRVEYTLTNRIPKSGLDMYGAKEKNPFFQTFEDQSSAHWIFWGVYADDEITDSCGTVPGQPLLLMGYNRDTLNGGLVKFAEIERGKVDYYPLESCQLLQSDLTVIDVRVHENRVSIDAYNQGELNAYHVRVRLNLVESKREMDAILPQLKPQEEKTVRFRLMKSPSDKHVVVEIDPENEILEADEGNNRMERTRPFWGW